MTVAALVGRRPEATPAGVLLVGLSIALAAILVIALHLAIPPST
ncbi:hypothetical protein [Bosea sp. 685]|nr:hypothetical protein [Bosea sp. 685]WNJ87980.1 hypothetical protein RMR04_00070 [Bosea sp. 685]